MTGDGRGADDLPRSAINNIEAVLRLREEAWAHRSASEKLADRIGALVGRGTFVASQAAVCGLWAAFNTNLIRVLPVFDPYPFGLLSVLISFEAVIIAAFVLIKQTRMGRVEEHRAHLELQMILLTEREVTKLLEMTERIAVRLGLHGAMDAEARELTAETAVEKMANAVRERLPED